MKMFKGAVQTCCLKLNQSQVQRELCSTFGRGETNQVIISVQMGRSGVSTSQDLISGSDLLNGCSRAQHSAREH